MKKIALFLAGLLISLVAYSTDTDSESLGFGTYQNKEFTFTRYEPDTLAEAVFLSDVGRSYFEFDTDNGNTFLHFIRRFRIKILSKAGFDWSNVEIPLRKDGDNMDELRIVEGVTYTMENGKVHKSKLEQSSVYAEDRNADFKIMKFAMPDVQVGSVIEVQYEVKSPFVFFFNNWEFQKSIPVIYSEFTACMVPFYNYTYLLQGRNKFDEESSGESLSDRTIAGVKFHDMVYTFTMKNMAAFRSEPFITCPEDYMVKLNFQLCEFISPEGAKTNYLSSWPQFCGTMLSREIFGGKINAAASKSKGLLKNMTLPDSLENKAKFIYDWVVTSFSWNGQYEKYSDTKTSDFMKTRKGSSADINLFLIGMLRSAGVEVFPVLISTRDHGKFKVDTPFDFFFNYVIAAAWINGKYVLLDATEPTIGFGNVPSRCINEKGFLIRNKKAFNWVALNDGKTSMERYTLQLTPTLGADSTDCQVRMNADGHFAMDYRETFQSKKNEMEKAVLSSDLSMVGSLTLQNEKDPSKPFEADYKARIRQNEENGTLWLKPFLGFMSMGNPLKKPTRLYPIDLIYKQGRSFDVTIRIPDGYELSRMPSIPSVDDMNFRLTYTYVMEDKNNLSIKASYEFKKEIYEASVYDKLKNYFRMVDQVFNQTVVLVKKS
jgi:hypothetical protein